MADKDDFDLTEATRKLREEAEKAYKAGISKVAKDVYISKVTATPTEDPDGRREKRRRRDKRIADQERESLALAGVSEAVSIERTMAQSDFLAVDFFVKGLAASRSIGKIEMYGGRYSGTGFLCAPGMIMTNHHVLPSVEVAERSEIRFETYDGLTVIPQCRLSPETFWWTNKEHDVSIVALDPLRGNMISDRLGWHSLKPEQGKVALGDPTGIVQYPQRRGKTVAIHNSTVVFLQDDDKSPERDRSLWYSCDTEPGSSGSPVFNKHWEVVALHHAAVPAKNDKGEYVDEDGNVISKEDYKRDDSLVAYVANQGIRASRIVAALNADAFAEKPQFLGAKEAIIASWNKEEGQREVGLRWSWSGEDSEGGGEGGWR